MLVLLLVLGHVCDLAAFADLDAHHSVDGHSDEQWSSCDAAPATSSPGHARVWTALEIAAPFPAADSAPAHRPARFPEDSAALVDRPPLFLLYASLLI